MVTYQVTSTVIGIFIAGSILYLVRRDHLHGSYAIWWLCVAIIVVVLGIYPRLIDHLARLVGVNYPPILALVLGLGMILLKMLTMDIHRSKQERRIRRLVQQLAIVEQQLASTTADKDAENNDNNQP